MDSCTVLSTFFPLRQSLRTIDGKLRKASFLRQFGKYFGNAFKFSGFVKEEVGASVLAGFPVLGIRIVGKDYDYGRRGPARRDVAKNVYPAAVAEPYIQRYHIRLRKLYLLRRFISILGFAYDLHPRNLRQHGPERLADNTGIFHNKDLHRTPFQPPESIRSIRFQTSITVYIPQIQGSIGAGMIVA